MPSTRNRVPSQTSDEINFRIQCETERRVRHFEQHREGIPRRLRELDEEWDIERAIDANASTLALVGVALGATWRHWSAYPGAVEPTVRCPQITPGEEEQPCTPLVPEPPEYSDTLTPRIAAEGVFPLRNGIAMKGRAGYAFEPSPAPEQSRVANDFDNHRSVIGLGYGLSLDRPLPRIDIDLFGQVRSKPHLAVALRTLGAVTGAGAWGDGHEVKAVDYFMRSIAICKEIGNELEVAKSYRAFSGYVSASAHYQSIPEIQREAQKLSQMADEIFERHRIVVSAHHHAIATSS